MPFPSDKPRLIYWQVCGRGDFCQLCLYAGNVEYDLDSDKANTWPSFKDETPFGWLPVLVHGDMELTQGGALNRYCAKLAGFYPEDPVQAAKNDMIHDQCQDLFAKIFTTKKGDKDEKIAAWKSLKEEYLPAQFALFERYLEKSGKPYFGGDSPSFGDVSFFAVYGIYEHAELGTEEILDKYPKLKATTEGVKEMGKVKEFVRGHPYFHSNPEHASF
eukprot:CAMPEP_0185732282 /NCGR_PEP_ID=MMETSP1171-20130828/15623_1 /TAXON_ID=374046 /ORGANISM="Helicotheca tamensis, Strain CCMP826" /LENGTH=216 /DNA_ID=CAMNT_0028401727 /DNA_START=106 /DNA_END=756 /DNA_ORIENTATION=+